MLIPCELNTSDFKKVYDLFNGAIFNRVDKETGKMYIKLSPFKISHFESMGIKITKHEPIDS